MKEIVGNLDAAVSNLVKMANEKADASYKGSENDIEQQRNSLPDIPLTKKEKLELENSMHLQNSHSSESILHDRELDREKIVNLMTTFTIISVKPPPKPSKVKREGEKSRECHEFYI